MCSVACRRDIERIFKCNKYSYPKYFTWHMPVGRWQYRALYTGQNSDVSFFCISTCNRYAPVGFSLTISFKSIFIISIISLVILSTIYDVKCTRERSNGKNIRFAVWRIRNFLKKVFFSEENNPLLTAFSALRNGKRLFTCKSNPSPDFINCFHGIRAIASQWIILHHIHTFTYYSNLNNFECIKVSHEYEDQALHRTLSSAF